jgi:aminopeptidase N
MKAHAFGNTVDTDLWSIMQTVAKKPILSIEHDFTRQEGLPLICVSQPVADLHLAELRFFDNSRPGRQGAAQSWTIPLSLAAHGAATRQILLNDMATLPLSAPVLVNAGQTAYARVLYPQSTFLALLTEVPGLAPADQLGLMNDGVALGLAGYAPLSNFFAVAQKLPADANSLVWRRVASLVMTLDHHYTDTPGRAAFRLFARGLLAPVLAQIGDEPRLGESPNTPVLRDVLTSALGHLGDDAIIARARQTLASNTGTPDEQRTALEIAAETADAAEFDFLLERARNAGDPLDKEQIYGALSGVADPALAKRLLAIALTNEVPAGSAAGLISGLAYHHPDLVWSEVAPHLAEPALGLARDEQWGVVEATARELSDPARIPEVQSYIDANVPEDARRPFTGAIAAIRGNQRITMRVLPALDRWIAQQGKK